LKNFLLNLKRKEISSNLQELVNLLKQMEKLLFRNMCENAEQRWKEINSFCQQSKTEPSFIQISIDSLKQKFQILQIEIKNKNLNCLVCLKNKY
jgi:predicted translin family RNA/ssDNA-binding protein